MGGLIQFERRPTTYTNWRFWRSAGPGLLVVGPRHAVEAILAGDERVASYARHPALLKAGIDPTGLSTVGGAAKDYRMSDLSLAEAKELALLLLDSATSSQLDDPCELGGPITVATVPRDPRLGRSEESVAGERLGPR